LLNIIEMLVSRQDKGNSIIIPDLNSLLEANPILYDRKGDQHYDIVSAFIKSIRGSDPQASVYWLARMIEGGEDPKFIARRMLISAAEDIGLANPNALLIASATFDSIEKIGMPEGRIVLSECAIYLATSAKSNSAYLAVDKALALVKETGRREVPLPLRNPANKLLKSIGHGKGYVYPHNYTGHFKAQEYMPSGLEGTTLYTPADNPKESSILKQLQLWWAEKYKSR
jgi:putative ATPase